jgi:hypothetical protein
VGTEISADVATEIATEELDEFSPSRATQNNLTHCKNGQVLHYDSVISSATSLNLLSTSVVALTIGNNTC